MSNFRGADHEARGDRMPIRQLAWFAAAAALLFILLKFAAGPIVGDPAAFDRALLLALRDPADPAVPAGPFRLRKAMIEITGFGGGIQLGLIVIAAAGLLMARRAAGAALLLAAATASGGWIVTLLKERVAHPRPRLVEHFVQAHSASFPSAHAANSAIVFLTLAALFAGIETDRAAHRYMFSAAILLTMLVGVSRVYLGVHWPSDVAAGWMLGAAWACLWSMLARAILFKRVSKAR